MSHFNLYSIGYSGFHNIDDFLSILEKNKISSLVDVRSSSNFSSYFNEYNNLKNRIKDSDILYYLSFGDMLGARPKDDVLYTDRMADFTKMSQSPLFIKGCQRIRNGLEKFQICIMCAEKDPIDCHRAILVARNFNLLYPEIKIFHIHPSSDIEPQEELDKRIIDMFESKAPLYYSGLSYKDKLREAYISRGKEIAYHKKPQREREPS